MGGALETYSHRHDTVICYTVAGNFRKILIVSTTEPVYKLFVLMEFIFCFLVMLLQPDILLKLLLQNMMFV